jgi:transcriptional regulator with XRE-family HTH domain
MRLKELRKQRKLNQQAVADALNCSQSVYSRYENGSYEPSLEILLKLADFFQVSLDELVGRTPMEVVVKHETPPPQGDDVVRLQFSLEDAPEDENELERLVRQTVVEELAKRGL